MLFFLLNAIARGIKIHKNYISSNSLIPKENDLCPTYYPGLYVKNACQSIGKNYTKGSAEPAYLADSTETGFSITLDHCNYSNYIVRLLFSLISIKGSRAVKLNVNSCCFTDNEMINLETGVFFLSKGPHQATITGCTFIRNQGAKNSILGETCAKLTMNDCYIAHNIANERQGQISISALSGNKNAQTSNSNDDFQITFSNLIFYLNIGWPTLNQNNIMLINGYTSISFKNCSFTCGNGEAKNMIGLKGNNIEISFTDCCFFSNYSGYNYYHIFFDTGSSGHATFSGKNSFSGNKQNAINKNLAETDEEVYNIDKCISKLDEPTETPFLTETETTQIFSSTINPATSQISPSSSQITNSQSIAIPTATPTASPAATGSSDGGDGSDCNCKFGFNFSIWLIVLLAVSGLLVIVLAFIAGWFLSKKHYENDDDQNPLKSDLLFSTPD